MEIFAFANQKGGVGKTTLAVHLAIRAQQLGYNTLLVDLDQQGSATYLCTGDTRKHQDVEHSALDLWYPDRDLEVMTGVAPGNGEALRYGFDLLPAYAGLDRVDDDLNAGVAAIRSLRDRTDYDVVVIDCPPAPGVRQLAPLMVANTHVIPVTPDKLGTQGIAQALQLHQQKIQRANPQLDLQILINRLKANSATNKFIAQGLSERLGDKVLPYWLFEREDVRSALNKGKPYWDVCKDAQAKTWREAFDSLLDGVPAVEDAPDMEEPDNVEDMV